jgi:hypothetical protein
LTTSRGSSSGATLLQLWFSCGRHPTSGVWPSPVLPTTTRPGYPCFQPIVGPKSASRWVMAYVVGTVSLSLWLQPISAFGTVYLVMATASGFVFVWMGVRLLRQPTPAAAMSLFKFSGVYLGLLFNSNHAGQPSESCIAGCVLHPHLAAVPRSDNTLRFERCGSGLNPV